MKTVVLAAQEPGVRMQALTVLRGGGLVAFPTDTVYGLGALAFEAEAVMQIYTAKDRPVEKAIPVLIADVEDLKKVVMNVTPMAARLAASFWPGALTLVLEKHPDIPEVVSATSTVGIRVPDHPVACMLLRDAGPMAVTSANLSGQPSPCTAWEVLDQLDGRIDMIIDGGRTPGGMSSSVVDCSGGKIAILREGPISWEEIRTVAGSDI
jgi:L-threonylcarbamoyladenylate synthase